MNEIQTWCDTSTFLQNAESTASMQDFFLNFMVFFKYSTAASIEVFYAKATLHLSRRNAPRCWNVSLVSIEHCKTVTNAILQLRSKSIADANEYCIDNESFLIEVILCSVKSLFFWRGTVDLTEVAFVSFRLNKDCSHFCYSSMQYYYQTNECILTHTDCRKHNAAVRVPHVQHVPLTNRFPTNIV